ncbi:MAG: hypothetical protein LBV75_04110 [Paludibacter sp.]|jgi:hypothetical protein|nr:hypothetical protein [Paludibacter sp.]
MRNPEEILRQRFGNKNYFRVPDNYFDNFANRWQDSHAIAVKSVTHFNLNMRTWLYMAAMLVGVLFLARTIYSINENHRQAAAENYELYLYSQVEESDVIDYYLTNSDL